MFYYIKRYCGARELFGGISTHGEYNTIYVTGFTDYIFSQHARTSNGIVPMVTRRIL